MDSRVQIVLRLIEDNFHRKLSLVGIASVVNLSPWRLAHLFKAETGTSLQRYLSSVRMENARLNLETSLKSVKEIAASVGMSETSHFTKSFKASFGLTPTEYRTVNLNPDSFAAKGLDAQATSSPRNQSTGSPPDASRRRAGR
jgi:AraC family transcriptional regulator of arabinose operon